MSEMEDFSFQICRLLSLGVAQPRTGEARGQSSAPPHCSSDPGKVP